MAEPWGDPIEVERRRRIRVAAAAYAYEYEDDPIMDDATFDALCLEVDPQFATGNDVLDKFFREEFSPDTGSWVGSHPEFAKLKPYVQRIRDAIEREKFR